MDGIQLEEEDMEEKMSGLEKTALVKKEESFSDGEVYPTKICLKARSFRFGLLVSLICLVLLFIGAIIIISVLSVRYKSRRYSYDNELTLDDVFKSEFQRKSFTGDWIEDQLVSMSTEKGVVLYDPSSNNESNLITAEKLKSLNDVLGVIIRVVVSPLLLSGDERLLLVANSEKIYRHSSLADYFIYSLDTGEVVNLTKPDNHGNKKFQYVAWSPSGDLIAYVLGYNIYVVDVTRLESSPIPITTGGSKNGIIYGIPDWVYEEEVISDNYALWWSPDSTKLLFGAFNDINVEVYSYPLYGDKENQYDTIVTIPYPKPGTVNPTVTMYVSNVTGSSSKLSLPPGYLYGFDHYMAYSGWLDADRPYVAWLNRTQTFIEFCTYEDNYDECNIVYNYEVPGQWVEQYSAQNVHLFPQADGAGALLTLLSQELNGDGFTHLALVPARGEPTFLTGPGSWVVTDIVGRYQDNILYISAEKSPLSRHLYSYNMATQNSSCLSCDQETWGLPKSPNPSIPDTCDYFNTVSCDGQLSYCVLQCSGPCIPYSILAHFDENSQSLEGFKVLEGNGDLRDAVEPLNLPRATPFTIPGDDDVSSLNGMMTFPPGFDSTRQYPVLVYVYGGPNSQVVSDACILLRLSDLFFISNLSLILVSVDGRGTGFRSDNFKFSVFGKLGILETEDQLRTGRYLQSLSYVDGNKLAIYGSSYGGYMAAMVGSSGSGVYSAAISISPVSDWLYYDSIYTERYMRKPNDNLEGYKYGSVLSRAKELADVDYLLVHGTADDNVHYQHTAQLAEALTQADVQFRMQVYTDKNHGLSGGTTKRHLYQLISDFLRESFQVHVT